MFYPYFVLAFMNFCERVYWNIRLSLAKDFLFIDGYAAINRISFKSKEEVIKHFFSCKDSNNNGLNPEKLSVKEAHVGYSIKLRRYRPRGRGRGEVITKPFSHLTIVVEERI